MESRLGGLLRIAGPLLIAYSIVGLLVEAAVPQLLPENGLTTSVGDAADSARYLERTPI